MSHVTCKTGVISKTTQLNPKRQYVVWDESTCKWMSFLNQTFLDEFSIGINEYAHQNLIGWQYMELPLVPKES